MAALCRQVCGRRGLPSLAWVGAARRAPPPRPPGRPRALTAACAAAEPPRPARGPEDVSRGVLERPGAAAGAAEEAAAEAAEEAAAEEAAAGAAEEAAAEEAAAGAAEEAAEEAAAAAAEVRRSLADMGFTEALAGDLLRIRPGTPPGQRLAVVAELVLLGLRPEPVCQALGRSPRLLTLPVPQLQRRAGYLRKLGLQEGKLRRVLQCCPDVFCAPQQTLERVVSVLRERCLFSAQQVTQVLHRCPHVLQEDPQELEYKFQYAYFRMGIKHADVVKTDFLQYPIAKTRQRHVFLERLGRYQTPDKKGQTQVANPLLKDILRVSEAEFLASTARSSAEEFDVFKKLLAREEEEELASLGCEDGGACPSEEEEEEGEEEEL